MWCSCSMCFVYSSAACQCNGHSQCVNESVCEKCEDLTTGRHCESCISGFYGDPTNGGSCQREYPWAVQSSTKSTSQSFCARLHLTCQYFTVQFDVDHFPDSWLHSKAIPRDIKDLLRSTANTDSQSIGQQINCPFLRQLNLAYQYITAMVCILWFFLIYFFWRFNSRCPSEIYIYLVLHQWQPVNKPSCLHIFLLSVLCICCTTRSQKIRSINNKVPVRDINRHVLLHSRSWHSIYQLDSGGIMTISKKCTINTSKRRRLTNNQDNTRVYK